MSLWKGRNCQIEAFGGGSVLDQVLVNWEGSTVAIYPTCTTGVLLWRWWSTKRDGDIQRNVILASP